MISSPEATIQSPDVAEILAIKDRMRRNLELAIVAGMALVNQAEVVYGTDFGGAIDDAPKMVDLARINTEGWFD